MSRVFAETEWNTTDICLLYQQGFHVIRKSLINALICVHRIMIRHGLRLDGQAV
jgi:hypothetical protein